MQLTETVNDCIARYDQKIERAGSVKKYGHTTLLRQVKGVGPITSLAYVLTLEDPATIQQQSRGRALSGAGAEAGRLGGQSTPVRNQQGRRSDVTTVAGREFAIHVGSLRTGHRLTAVRIAIVRTRRKECEEASRGGGRTKAGRVAASLVGVAGDVYEPLHHTGDRNQNSRSGGCISRAQPCFIKLNRRNREKTEAQ